MSKLSKFPLAVGCIALMAVSGCIDRESYKTTPVEVRSSKGVVICQLYTHKRVLWDEAVSVPPGMTIAEGDRICQDEGLRRLGKS